MLTRPAGGGQAGPARVKLGDVPTARARAPGRVTLIGDHTDYNGGLSLPMAIQLETEVSFTPKPGSFFMGIESDQFPDQPLELAVGEDDDGGGRIGGAAGVGGGPVPEHGRLAAALLRLVRPPAGGSIRVKSTLPVGAGLSSSAAFAVALLLALGHRDEPLALARTCQEAERLAGAHVGLLDPLAIAGAEVGHALHIDFHTLETRQVRIPDDAAFVIVHSEAPRLLVDSPYATRRAECERAAQVLGRPLGLCTLGRPERAQRPGAAATGPARRDRVRQGARGRAGAGAGKPGRVGGDHDRGSPQPGQRLPGLGAGRGRTGR